MRDEAVAEEPARFGGATDVRQPAQRELFDRPGTRDSSWPGQSIGASLTSTPEVVARTALLVLRRGVWDGRRLLAEAGWTCSTGTGDRRPAVVAQDPVLRGDEAASCEAYRRSAHAPDLRDRWSAAASR